MNNKMLLLKLLFLFSIMVNPYLHAETKNFPTIDRVLFVNECVRENGGGLDSLYKCSCVMDYFVNNLSYEEFDNMDASTHGINTTGERSAIWRDPDDIREGIKRLKKIKIEARKQCNFKGDY